jgi:exonuclease SbcD
MDSPVYYAGSPCGLDITESDRRTYLIYDTDTNKVDRRVLNTPILYFRAEFVMVPVEDEAEHLRKMIEEVKDNWNLTPEEINKSQIRISIVGFSSDRVALQDILDEEFRGFTFYKGERPTVAKVAVSYDIDRQTIAQGVEEKINNLEWSDELGLTDVDAIRLAALHIIYGE